MIKLAINLGAFLLGGLATVAYAVVQNRKHKK